MKIEGSFFIADLGGKINTDEKKKTTKYSDSFFFLFSFRQQKCEKDALRVSSILRHR